MYQRNSHCSTCGQAFAADQPWPRRCATCGRTTYLNPLPVAVVLVPVDDGVLAVRRTIPPQVGRLALPGGFITAGETWQEAGAREVGEETGLLLDPAEIADFRTLTSPEHLLVFGLAQPRPAGFLAGFAPTDETSECVILRGPVELAFPLHTQALAEFFARREAAARVFAAVG